MINRFVNLLSVDILVKSSSFILIPVYLKLLSQTEFGLYNYLLSIISFFSQILNFGLFVAQSKIYQDTKAEERGKFLFTLHVLLFTLLIITLAILYGFNIDIYLIGLLFKSSFNYTAFRLPMLLGIVTSIYSFMLYNYLLTAEKVRVVQRYNVLRLILLNVCVIASLYLLKGNKVDIRLTATYIVEALLVLSFSYQCIKEMSAKINYRLMLRSAKIGFPIMASAILGIIFSFSDKYFLEKKAGFVDLSVYYLAFSVASVIPLVFNTLQNIWLPIFLKEKDLEKNLVLTRKMIFRVFGLFIILSIAIVVFIKGALYVKFIDAKYNKVIYILPIILLSLSIENTSHLVLNYVTYFEQTYIIPIVSILLCGISISLNIYFIGKYGLYGAACSSLCIGILCFITYSLILRYNVIKYRKKAAGQVVL